MKRLNTKGRNLVPIILAFCALSLAGGCDRLKPEARKPAFKAEELFFIEQYLRLVEARGYAAMGDSTADGRFALLATELPADSLRAIAERISREEPERWLPIYEEIVRRKKTMESEKR